MLIVAVVFELIFSYADVKYIVPNGVCEVVRVYGFMLNSYFIRRIFNNFISLATCVGNIPGTVFNSLFSALPSNASRYFEIFGTEAEQ